MKYNPSKIEKKWQLAWEQEKLYHTPDNVKGKKNYMLLTEFPYPSGNLHIGHWYAFALPDILGRFLRMNGYNVLYPIGFDAFGLPAENAAIKNGVHPEEWTKRNIATMSKQLKSMGASFDWSRAVSTTDPRYYRWGQWIFLQLYKKGLAYRAATQANWCPKDKTVLANEQVINGNCERCDSPVIQKDIDQWLFKTTEYAERLLEDMEELDWPESTKLAQKNWIGRSDGAFIRFPILDFRFCKHLEVFTTRADTLFGAMFTVVSPELAQRWIHDGWDASSDVRKYVKKSLSKRQLERVRETDEKTGVQTGLFVINPVNEEKIPLFVADYVLGSYGTGAVMAVPAHDKRDWAFAKKYKLPVRMVICPNYPDKTCPVLEDAYEGEGHLVESGQFDGMPSEKARVAIAAMLRDEKTGRPMRQYRLHDWVLSRQRYWGVPIPMVKCPDCGYIPVPESELPIKLPSLENFKPTDDGHSPLARVPEWVKTKCPKCNGPAERETDTMDTFVDSSWYFIRYVDPNNDKSFASPEKMKKWLPVQMYVGGAEHNTMHLLYSRFFTKALFGLDMIHFDEPFTGRRNHGVILGSDSQKMSKSRGNVVDPDKEIEVYGADTVRMYLAFMAPYDHGAPWDPKGINGVYRFLNRVWRYANSNDTKDEPVPDLYIVHTAIKRIGDDIQKLEFNTGVSELMKLLNHLETRRADRSALEILIKLLAPFAPHITEEIWSIVLKKSNSVHTEEWPRYDERHLVSRTINIPVQVNGKIRTVLNVSPDITEERIKEIALASKDVIRHLKEKKILKTIYVQGKMLSIVAK